jgi:RNA polymerase sigma factor (sigma-70 family)
MDEAEFVELVPLLGRQLRRTAFLMCGSWSTAEDAAQEGLVRVFLALPRIERKGGIEAYARRCVVSALLDQAKRPWRRESPDVVAEQDHADPTDAEALVDQRLTMIQALQRLPSKQRAAVVLRYYDELSVRETAEALRVSEGTVKSQTAKGLANLRSQILMLTRREGGGER